MPELPEWLRFTLGAALAAAIITCLVLAILFLAHAITYR